MTSGHSGSVRPRARARCRPVAGIALATVLAGAAAAIGETSTEAFLSQSEVTLPSRSLSITSADGIAGCGSVTGGRRAVDGDASDWIGEPGWIAGQARVDGGEYIWTDYPFDDDGSDAFQYPGEGVALESGAGTIGKGNALQQRYGSNAADVVELRAAVDPDYVYFLVRLNFLNATDSTVVGLALDVDGNDATGAAAWPLGAQVATPGTELFVTAWGACGVLHDGSGPTAIDAAGGAVAVGTRENVIEIALPRALLGGATSLEVAGGSGLWDPARSVEAGITGGWMDVQALPRVGQNASAAPRGKGAQRYPNVWNLLFRDDEETADACGGVTWVDVDCAIGNPRTFMTFRQHEVLRGGTTGDYAAVLDLAAIDDDADTSPLVLRKGDERHFIRVYRSRVDAEGITMNGANGVYMSRYQPYAIWLPGCYGDASGDGLHDCHVPPPGQGYPRIPWPEDSAPGLFLLHGGGGSHVSNPPRDSLRDGGRDLYGIRLIFEEFEEEGAPLFVSLLGRGQRQPWWRGAGEIDVLEVFEDVRNRYDTDPERQGVSGASLGGYGSWRIGSLYPDLFTGTFPHCSATHEASFGARYDGNVDPGTQPFVIDVVLPSLVNQTVRLTAGTLDPLTPVHTNRRLADAAFAAGLDFHYTEYLTGGHCFDLSQATHNWMENHVRPAAELLALPREATPARVTYVVDPRHYPAAPEPVGAFDLRDFGIEYTGAYWVSGLELRPAALDAVADGTAPGGVDETVVGRIDAVSHGRGGHDRTVSACGESFGLGGPDGPGGDPTITPPPVPSPQFWKCQSESFAGAPTNALDLRVRNLDAATIDLAGAGLTVAEPLSIEASGDGSLVLRLAGAAGTTANGPCVALQTDDGGDRVVGLLLTPLACAITLTP